MRMNWVRVVELRLEWRHIILRHLLLLLLLIGLLDLDREVLRLLLLLLLLVEVLMTHYKLLMLLLLVLLGDRIRTTAAANGTRRVPLIGQLLIVLLLVWDELAWWRLHFGDKIHARVCRIVWHFMLIARHCARETVEWGRW